MAAAVLGSSLPPNSAGPSRIRNFALKVRAAGAIEVSGMVFVGFLGITPSNHRNP